MTELEQLLIDIPELNKIEIPKTGTNRPIKSFVIRGQKLKPYQLEALRKYFYKDCLIYDGKLFDFKTIFKNSNPVIIEIGFGMGTSTISLAKKNPQKNYLAFEVFLYGFSKTLKAIEEEGLTNLKLMRFNAVEAIVNSVPASSISGFHIFFPDPWQKKRQNKRRLINPEFTQILSRKLTAEGYIYAVTDWDDYAMQIEEVFSTCPLLMNPKIKIDWRPKTSFEQKGLDKNHKISEFYYLRRNSL